MKQSPSTASPTPTNLAPLIRRNVDRLMKHLELDQAKFARRVGISTATMSRIMDPDAPKPVSVDILDRIAQSLGLTRAWLLHEDDPIPTLQQAPLLGSDNEGLRLKRFLKRHDISQKRLAVQLSVFQPTVTYYTQARQLTPEVKARVASALGTLLERTVTELEVFGVGYNPAVMASALEGQMVLLPRLPTAARRGLNADKLDKIRFGNTHNPDTTFLLDARQAVDSSVTDLFALEVASTDRMEPRLVSGDWVLMEEVAQPLHHTVRQGIVAVLTLYGDFYVRQVRVNDLAGSGGLTLTNYHEGTGHLITLQAGDIAALFRLPRIIDALL